MKRFGVFLLPPVWNASPLLGYPPRKEPSLNLQMLEDLVHLLFLFNVFFSLIGRIEHLFTREWYM